MYWELLRLLKVKILKVIVWCSQVKLYLYFFIHDNIDFWINTPEPDLRNRETERSRDEEEKMSREENDKRGEIKQNQRT